MTLDQTPTGVAVTVDSSTGASPALIRRLAELGVRVGATLKIQSRTSGGGAILAIGDDRVAVSRRLLRGVVVHEREAAAADV